MKLSFVIPCYCSERTVGQVVESIRNMMGEHKDYEYEIVLVNDCSPDNVNHVIQAMPLQWRVTAP